MPRLPGAYGEGAGAGLRDAGAASGSRSEERAGGWRLRWLRQASAAFGLRREGGDGLNAERHKRTPHLRRYPLPCKLLRQGPGLPRLVEDTVAVTVDSHRDPHLLASRQVVGAENAEASAYRQVVLSLVADVQIAPVAGGVAGQVAEWRCAGHSRSACSAPGVATVAPSMKLCVVVMAPPTPTQRPDGGR